MNLSIICPFIGNGLGGLERVGADLCNAMSNRGHKVSLLFYGCNSPKYQISDEIAQINEIENFDKTIARLSSFRPEVVLGMSSGYKSIYFLKIAKTLRVPFCIHESTHFERFCGENWAKPRNISFEQAVLEREAVCSQAYKIRHVLNHSSSFFPSYILPQVEIFPNPINFSKVKTSSVCHKTIINVGGLKKVKNIFPLLNVFKRIIHEYPEWKLKIIGEGFEREIEYQKSVHNYISDNGLSQNVFVLGNITDMVREYENSSIHVIMSLNENFSMCTAEAMACGIPSIGYTNSFGISSLIDDGLNGILVNSRENVSELKEALERLISNSELREKFSKNALEKAKLFDPNIIFDLWENVFVKSQAYRTNDNLLFNEQSYIDKEKALFSRRKSIELTNNYLDK